MRKRYLLFLVLLIPLFYFLFNLREEKEITNFLFVHKDKKINHIALFFYVRPKNLVYCYQFNSKIVDKNLKKVFNNDDFFFTIKN